MKTIKRTAAIAWVCLPVLAVAQTDSEDTVKVYKKRVLETVEVDFLTSYYRQDGDNAAVTGGTGTEQLDDATAAFIIAIPLNDDDVLTIDAGISAYTSASSSNVNPFDGRQEADPFVASSGESRMDVWSNGTIGYSHSSDDRNTIWSGKLAISNEYDYNSVGVSGSFARLFNKKNTEFSVSAGAYFDRWNRIYPIELRPPGQEDDDDENFDINAHTVIGNTNYQPLFTPFDRRDRNSYSAGMALSQILSKRLQGVLSMDVIYQQGLLSTPFQRVYFKDIANSYVENFHLAEDVERLPDTRTKFAVGGRLHYFVSDRIVMRTFYRYYYDDWGITSHTTSLEVPIKISDKWTVYPMYRWYMQTSAQYFKPYDQHLSTDAYYTSDYDLSAYQADQYGLGISYTDIFTKRHIWKFGIKSIDLKYAHYARNSTFASDIITLGVKFVMDKKKT